MNWFPNALVLSQIPVVYYMFPLTAIVALVYSASRFEDPKAIFRKAGRLFMQIIVFLVGVLLLLYLLTARL
ncbi:hypothetical protein GYB59_04160 [bacterium]|uniref:Uncharacterized protein n=1 Tax=Rubinisphaera brasiliensis (strain ATCC 49424 / DSM 5305 / JCM 21570 / IAM 15109 / NBRC 103401 / IFAM 1448) TaxID=756272 RepID=F0SMJ5_RUBBR|nr:MULTISPECIES: hypothetical protein [Rubinisphaera]ADY57757.1 hypothetical protein Plabr_0127 [Rubinisphaera brasiliensis DSM 5305]MBB01838.1 hypothetical protein [Planctomyces sp.]MBR9800927.1 hypothetical protein [bacterium]